MKPKVRPLEVIPLEDSFLVKDPAGISEELVVSYHGLLLMWLMDGTRDLSDIRADFFRKTGIILSEAELFNFIETLRRELLLDGEDFKKAIEEKRAELLRRGTRAMSHAGVVYPADAEECKRFLTGKELEKKEFIGLMVPHMDLRVARETYWQAYGRLKGEKKLVVILGVSHYWHEMPFSVLPLDMETPFGVLPTRKDLIEKLQKSYSFDITHDLLAYTQEHSIEFAAVYAKMLFPEASALALIVSYGEKDFLKALAENLLRLIDRELPNALIISSVDLSHVGKKFGDPFSYDPSSTDLQYLSLLEKLMGEQAFEMLVKTNNPTRIDGQYTNFVFAHMLKKAGLERGELFDYRSYYEKPTDSIVSYASMGF